MRVGEGSFAVHASEKPSDPKLDIAACAVGPTNPPSLVNTRIASSAPVAELGERASVSKSAEHAWFLPSDAPVESAACGWETPIVGPSCALARNTSRGGNPTPVTDWARGAAAVGLSNAPTVAFTPERASENICDGDASAVENASVNP